MFSLFFIINSIVVNPIFSARSHNTGRILGLQYPQPESWNWKNRSRIAIPNNYMTLHSQPYVSDSPNSLTLGSDYM